MSKRPLYFELHIRPLFREIDRMHMLSRFDLWKYEDVAPRAADILRRARKQEIDGLMPPGDSGGPWPDELIAVFERWMNEGMKRLELAEGSYRVLRTGSLLRLEASGSPPEDGWAVWLDRVPGRTNPPEFILYAEPPKPFGGGTDDPFEIREAFDAGGATSVTVTDKNGTHSVPIP